MSIFRRLTGKHPEKSSGAEQLQTSGGARELSRSVADLAKHGQVGPLFEKLVDGGTVQLLELHEAKQSLLHIAAEHGHKPVVKLLLLHSAISVDQSDAHGNTPLLLACLHKRIEVVDYLLRKNASVKVANMDGSTALHFLVRHQFNEQIQALLDAIIQLGGDKEAKDKQGETPLLKAAASLNNDAANWLLSHDADVNSTNQAGETALHKATRMLHADEEKAMKLIEILLNKGANHETGSESNTPLSVASKKSLVPQLQEMFQKAKERRLEKQQRMLGLPSAGSRRLMDLPADWASRDSKQRSVYLMQKWGTLKKNKDDAAAAAAAAAATADGHTPVPKLIPPEIAVSEPPTDTGEEDNIADLNNDRETQNLSSTLLIAEMERKEIKPEGPPPSPSSASAGGVCLHIDGYRVEDGSKNDKPISPRHMVLDLPPEPYKKTYVQQKHWNFVGYLNVVGDEKKEPAAISILMRVNEELGFTSCAALIRTQLGVVELPMRPPTSLQPMDLLNALMSDKTRFTGNPQFTYVDAPDLMFEFLEYEKNDPQRCTCLPIGVIYVPRAGMSHLEVWDASNQTSDAFEQFLNIIGDRVTLKDWPAYAGGLDTVYDKKGKFSVYTKWRGLEIMFHVSTLLPYNANDHAKVQIARVIGNDITNIVFLEGEGKYNPGTFNSAVTHVYGVVHPEPSGTFRTAFASKSFVPKFGPDLPHELARENFKDYFLTKIVNGHFASQRSKGLNMMYSRPREVLLRALVEQFEPQAPPTPMKEERRSSDNKKDKKLEKAEKEKAEKEKEKLSASASKFSKRKSVEIQQAPLKQLLADAQKEKDKTKEAEKAAAAARRNSPAPNRDRRMSHSNEHEANLLSPADAAKVAAAARTHQADSPQRALEASRSDSNVATTAGKRLS